VLRSAGGKTCATDNGNWILDCRFDGGIDDPPSMEKRIAAIPGVVESGLFIGLAHVLFVGQPDGTCEVRRKPA
jgi:ribose 5-phosphate isomerase A